MKNTIVPPPMFHAPPVLSSPFPLPRAVALASSSARSSGIAEGASDCTGEVLDGSLPDALGRPVDHSGSRRHRERAEQKIEALREQQKKLRR